MIDAVNFRLPRLELIQSSSARQVRRLRARSLKSLVFFIIIYFDSLLELTSFIHSFVLTLIRFPT